MGTYTQAALDTALEGTRNSAKVTARLLRPLAGGQPATDKGLAAFVEHHLKIEPETAEFDAAIARIKNEEIGERDTTPEAGEVKEQKVYSVNVIRRSDRGAFVGAHQIQAMLKQAASRQGFFVSRRGSKGGMSEMGTVIATDDSLQNPDRPWEIYLRHSDGGDLASPAETQFVKICGSVSSPQGPKSIVTHTEMAQEGATISFDFRWPVGKLTEKDMAETVWAATRIGLGSCLSLGYGVWEIVSMEIVMGEVPKEAKEKEPKKANK